MKVSEMLNSLGFKGVRNSNRIWIGNYNGYYFGVSEGSYVGEGNKETAFLTCDFKLSDNKGELLDLLENYKATRIINRYVIDNESLFLYFLGSDIGEDIKRILNELIDVFKKCEASNLCENCKTDKNLSFYAANDKVMLLCDDCANAMNEQFSKVRSAKNNYSSGFIGSLIGALIGSVLWVLFSSINFYVSFVGYVIAYAAFKGYAKMGGKLDKIGVIINIATIIFSIIAAQYLSQYISTAREYQGLSFETFAKASTSIQFWQAMLPRFALGIVFALLGCFQKIKRAMLGSSLYDMHLEKINL